MSDAINPQLGHDAAANLYRNFSIPENSNCIRILEILPTDTRALDTSIRANIKTVSLDDKPNFTALSYVWGIDQQPCSIRCDSFDVKITQNCYDALLHLRKKFGNLTIWVDAICINQNDDNEKMHQISLMQTIFGQATTVYAWLGPGNSRSDRAMSYLARAGLSSYFSAEYNADGTSQFQSKPWRAAVSLFFLSLSCSHHPFPAKGAHLLLRFWCWLSRKRLEGTFTSYTDLNEVFDREWIKRIWTFQEVALAPNPVVVCGDAHLNWDQLTRSVFLLWRPGFDYDAFGSRTPNLDRWTKIVSSRSRVQSRAQRPPTAKDSSHTMSFEAIVAYQYFLKYTMTIHARTRRATDTLELIAGVLVLGFLVLSRWFLPLVPWLQNAVPVPTCASSALLMLIILDKCTFRSGCGWFAFKAPRMSNKVVPAVLQDDLVDTIVSRKSKEPRDKAIGVHGVLQCLAKRSMPMPSHSDSLDLIYMNLSLRLLEVSQSLQLLLPAALNRRPGLPSWVADWSQEMPASWSGDSSTPWRQSLKQPQPTWGPIISEQLVVQGHFIGTALAVYRFQTTTDVQVQREEEAHLHNLRTLSEIAAACRWNSTRLRCYFSYLVHREDSMCAQINVDQVPRWISYFKRSKETPIEEMLRRLKHIPPRPLFERLVRRTPDSQTPGKTMAQIHIEMCNFLANSGLSFFRCEPERNTSHPSFHGEQIGLCTPNTEIYDRVLYIPGVTSMLVVRGVGGVPGCPSANVVHLVSPADIIDPNRAYELMIRAVSLKVGVLRRFGNFLRSLAYFVRSKRFNPLELSVAGDPIEYIIV